MKHFVKFCIAFMLMLSFSSVSFAALTVEQNGKPDEVMFNGNTDNTTHFNDVFKNDWFYEDVMYVYNNGIMNGTDPDKFSPKNSVTRAMMITVIYRLAGSPVSDPSKVNSFSDITKNDYCYNAVIWGSSQKIVNGTGNDTFSPNGLITREQLAVMLYNYSKLTGKSNNAKDISLFPDHEDISPWAKEAMSWAVGNDIIKGNEKSELSPKGGATRAETAAIIKRYNALRD